MVLPLVPVMPTMRSCEEGQLKNRSAMRPTALCKSTTGALNTAGARAGASTPGAGLPQHRARAARGRLGRERDAVSLAPAQSKEEAAGAHVAAVESEIRDARIVRGHRRDAVEKPHEGYACAAHGAFACTSLVAGTFCRSSGGTSMRRSAPDMTLEKTGAATVPP